MSGNSVAQRLADGADRARLGGARRGRASRSRAPGSSRAEDELVFADLQLVAVGEAPRLDALAVDVGAVERAAVVQVPVAAAAHEQRVVARDGDVVEEDRRVGAPSDRHALAVDREALAGATAAGADDERRGVRGDLGDVERR